MGSLFSVVDPNDIILDLNYKPIKTDDNRIYKYNDCYYLHDRISLNKLTETIVKKSKFLKVLGRGGYGIVYEMTTESGELFALKQTTDTNEMLMIEYLQKNNINCNKIGCKYIYTEKLYNNEFHYLAYSLANGNLETIIKDLNIKIRFNILIEIAELVGCLEEKNLYYTDLKFSNILYSCSKHDNTFDIFLGDIGSIVHSNSIVSANTYPPIDTTDHVEAKTSILVWQLNVLLIQIFTMNYIKGWDNLLFYYKEMKKHKITDIRKFVSEVYKKFKLKKYIVSPEIIDFIENVLLNYNKISLETYIDELKSLNTKYVNVK